MKIINKILLPVLTLSAFAIISSTNASATTTSTTTAKPSATAKHTTASKKTSSKHQTTTKASATPETQKQIDALNKKIRSLTSKMDDYIKKDTITNSLEKKKNRYFMLQIGHGSEKSHDFSARQGSNDMTEYVLQPRTTGSNIKFGFGDYFGNNLRVGISMGFSNTSGRKFDDFNNITFNLQEKILDFLANIEYDLIKVNKLSMFVGAGAGVGVQNINLKISRLTSSGEFSDTEIMPEISGSLGLNFALNDRIDLFVKYSYYKMYGYNVGSPSGTAMSAPINIVMYLNNFTRQEEVFGIRYKF